MSLPPPAIARVLTAETVSNFGSMLSRLAIPWLATLALQATAAQMALLLLADVAAAALAALLLGPWVDRSGKRAVMLLTDAARALVLAALAWAAWQGQVSLALLLASSAANGALTIAFELARSAWMARSVPADQLPHRNAQLSVAGSVSEAVAFASGGWIYQGLGAAWSLAVDALSFLGSALCLRGVPEVRDAAAAGDRSPSRWRAWLDDGTAGLRAIAARPPLRALAVIEALQALSRALYVTSFMIFVARDLGLSTGVLGMIFATGALGSVIGAALAPRLGVALGPGRAMTLGLSLWALGALCVPMAAVGGALAIALLLAQQIVGDAGQTLHAVHDRTLRQTAVPPALLARADAGLRSVGQVATLAGALIGGVVGTALDARAVLWLAVLLAAGAALWAGLRLAERRLG